PPAAACPGPSFQTTDAVIWLAALSAMLVPPTAVTNGDEAGKLTDSLRVGLSFWLTHVLEPSSPEAASTEIPVAAATWNAVSYRPIPRLPSALRLSDSHPPSEAETTSGRWFSDSIASFSEFSTALGAALDSYTST